MKKNCDVIQQKVHKVGKRNFTREAFKENVVKMIKIVFLRKIVTKDIYQHHTEVVQTVKPIRIVTQIWLKCGPFSTNQNAYKTIIDL